MTLNPADTAFTDTLRAQLPDDVLRGRAKTPPWPA